MKSFQSNFIEAKENDKMIYKTNIVDFPTDKYSRVVFPVIFFAFHVTYWTLCLSISGQLPDDIVMLI